MKFMSEQFCQNNLVGTIFSEHNITTQNNCEFPLLELSQLNRCRTRNIITLTLYYVEKIFAIPI